MLDVDPAPPRLTAFAFTAPPPTSFFFLRPQPRSPMREGYPAQLLQRQGDVTTGMALYGRCARGIPWISYVERGGVWRSLTTVV